MQPGCETRPSWAAVDDWAEAEAVPPSQTLSVVYGCEAVTVIGLAAGVVDVDVGAGVDVESPPRQTLDTEGARGKAPENGSLAGEPELAQATARGAGWQQKSQVEISLRGYRGSSTAVNGDGSVLCSGCQICRVGAGQDLVACERELERRRRV